MISSGANGAIYTGKQIGTDCLPFTLADLLPVVRATPTITNWRIARRLETDINTGGRIFSTQISGVAGTLMGRLHEIDKDIPLINVLVVRRGKTLPSKGADEQAGQRLNPFAISPIPNTTGRKDDQWRG